MKSITSKDNDLVKEIVRLLSSKKERQDKGLFVVEGIRSCLEIINAGGKIKSLFVTNEAESKFFDQIRNIMKYCNDYYEITQTVAKKMSETKAPQGIFAVFAIPKKNVIIKPDSNYILLCSLQDPGNIGTIIRSADAFNIDALLLTDDCPDIYSPKVLRSTIGTAYKLPIKVYSTVNDAVNELKNNGITVYAAALHKSAVQITDCDFTSNSCVMIGNEGNGLTDEEMMLADERVIIPMNPHSESLNAGVAASIFAWEMSKYNNNL